MSNYNSLKATIDANIKQNGRQEITGQILNSVLNQMVNTLGAGYQFAGVATTATNPGTPDAKVFYIANGKGTYTNFGGVEVTEDEVVVLYYDTEWHKVATGIASQAKLSELEDNRIGVIKHSINMVDGQELNEPMINVKQGKKYRLKIKPSVDVGLLAVTSDNSASGTRYFWKNIYANEEYIVYFVAVQDVLLRIWTSGDYTRNGTIEYSIFSEDSVLFTKEVKSILTVGSAFGCDYTNIQDALDNCNDSKTNPITIYVLNGEYTPFSMVNRGVDRHVSIIGQSKLGCIVKSNTGNYHTPGAEICTNGSIENITFIMDTDDEHFQPDSDVPYAYAAHMDFGNGAKKTIIRNCHFESNAGPAIGIGLHQDETLEFIDCSFIRYSGYGSDLGSFFVHSNTTPTITGQNLKIKGCTIKNQERISGLQLSSYSKANVLIQNTISKNKWELSATIGSDWILDEMSFNNLPISLNAN